MNIIYTIRKLFVLITLLSPLVSCHKSPTSAYNVAQPAPLYEHYGQQPNHPLPPPSHHQQHGYNHPHPPHPPHHKQHGQQPNHSLPPHHKQHSYQPHPPPPQPHEYFE